MKAERCALCDLPRIDSSWYCEEHSRKISILSRLPPPVRNKKDRIEGPEDSRRTFGAGRERVSNHEWCAKCGLVSTVGTGSCPLC